MEIGKILENGGNILWHICLCGIKSKTFPGGNLCSMSMPLPAKQASTGGRLFRSADNPDEVIIIFEWESIEKAKKFAQSEDLRKTMQRAGVNDKPDVYFLEEVERVSV